MAIRGCCVSDDFTEEAFRVGGVWGKGKFGSTLKILFGDEYKNIFLTHQLLKH